MGQKVKRVRDKRRMSKRDQSSENMAHSVRRAGGETSQVCLASQYETGEGMEGSSFQFRRRRLNWGWAKAGWGRGLRGDGAGRGVGRPGRRGARGWGAALSLEPRVTYACTCPSASRKTMNGERWHAAWHLATAGRGEPLLGLCY